MKLFLTSVSCLALSCCVVLSCAASPLGSPRPEAQANFQQLLETKSCPGCDLAGANMIRVDLRGVDLEGANLAGAKLFLADLSGANLKNSNLQGASLGGADLAGADLRGANLTGAVLEGAFLETAKIDGDFITRPHVDEESFAGSGEKVYVPAEDQSKQMPYSHDVAVGERKDLESPPPAIQSADSGDSEQAVPQSEVSPASSLASQSPEPSVTEEATSKKIVPMADAVVTEVDVESVKSVPPVRVEPEQDANLVSSKKIPVIEPVAKTPVVEEKAVNPEAEAAVDQVAKSSVAEESLLSSSPPQADKKSTDRIEQVGVIEEDIQIADKPTDLAEDIVTGSVAGGVAAKTEAGEGVSEPFKAAEENDGTVPEAASLDEVAGSSGQKTTAVAPALPQDERMASGEDAVGQKQEKELQTDQGVSSMIAQIEEEAQQQQPDTAAGMYTVETPEQAAAKQQLIIEKLFDEERCVGCDLSGMDLAGKNFKEIDLERVNFQGCNLQGADFEEANLKGANFRDADLQNADFSEADIYRADFSNANLTGARFEEALMDSANFTGAKGLVLGDEELVE